MSAPTLVLHVGAMKSGTTYVQDLLRTNAPALLAAGWWVPEQKRAVQAVRQLLEVPGVAVDGPAAGGGVPTDAADSPRWTALLEQVREQAAAPGRRGAVVSMEFLSFLTPAGAEAVAASASGLDLRVVLTVRDAAAALPSQWQSLTRNGATVSWPGFAQAARSAYAEPQRQPPRHGAGAFRRTQDVPRMLEAWAGAVGPDRFDVVTVPAPGAPRDLLWARCCAVLGVEPSATTTDGAFDNPRLGYGACELLRRVNALLALVAGRPYRRVVRRLTRDHLLPLRDAQSRPRLDAATAAFAADLNARTLAAAASRATLVGDPADLPTRADPARPLDPGDAPAPPPGPEVLDAARALHAGAVALCAEDGLTVPPELAAWTPEGLDHAVALAATVVGIAITGDVSHRPARPDR